MGLYLVGGRVDEDSFHDCHKIHICILRVRLPAAHACVHQTCAIEHLETRDLISVSYGEMVKPQKKETP